MKIIDLENLRLIQHSEIDFEKWDQTISKSKGNTMYPSSWYLDRIIDKWDALILGNYEYVMPLTKRKKLGVEYLYQPTYCQQLGVFPSPSSSVLQVFISFIKKQFKFIDISFNSAIPVSVFDQPVTARRNYILKLYEDYDFIAKNYSQHSKRNLKKAQKNSLSYVEGISLEQFFDFKLRHQHVKVRANDLKNLKSIVAYTQYKGTGKICGVYSSSNELCAVAFFIASGKRVTYLNTISSDEGKNLNAMYFLVNQFIFLNASKDLVLDFEGSMIPGVERFYKGFGAVAEEYAHLKINSLPIWLRWLKK